MDLATFAATGTAPAGSRVPPGSRYCIHYSDVTIDLRNVGDQRALDVRFPFTITSAAVTDLGRYAWWSDHQACVTRVWISQERRPPVNATQKWLNLRFDLTSLLPPPEPRPCDARVNGADGAITVARGSRVRFTVRLDAGPLKGRKMDWWATLATPFGWLSCRAPRFWTGGVDPALQAPVFSIPVDVPLLDTTRPRPGTSTIFFSLDARDGVPQGTCTDSVSVTVR